MDSDSDWDSLSGDGPSLKSCTDAQKSSIKDSTINGLPEKANYHFQNQSFQKAQTKTCKISAKTATGERSKYGGFKSTHSQDITGINRNLCSNQEHNTLDNLPYLQFEDTEKVRNHLRNKKTPNKIKTMYVAEQDGSSCSEHEGLTDGRSLDNNMAYDNPEHVTIKPKKQRDAIPKSEFNVQDKSARDNYAELLMERNFTNFVDPVEKSDMQNGPFAQNLLNFKEERYYYEKTYHNCYSILINNTALTPKWADRFEPHLRRVWQELFGVLHIILDIFLIFILELARFCCATLRKIIVGFITILGDSFWKPFLSSLFNSLLQPFFVLLWNVLDGVRTFIQPAIRMLSQVFEQLAILLRAFRLCEYKAGKETVTKNI
ncbi:uncharacterized protein LOC130613255 [Hydractinia symbiolongicarpus]|uniref:uncharacterized protein LOC130613255 n=1 Tax=Hydractinia symbiolongicarpus TaxID=13093 RepID=UPI00254A663A|nr:uncharacterized protein LOC130613255 [Hydractinia symbiolongicarpus]